MPACPHCPIQMPFQQDADVFAHGATVGAGLSGQIVIEGFGQMQLDIAVALEATTLFDSSGRRQMQSGMRRRDVRTWRRFPCNAAQVEGGVASITGLSRLDYPF